MGFSVVAYGRGRKMVVRLLHGCPYGRTTIPDNLQKCENMTAFADLADTVHEIASDACNNFDMIPLGDLLTALTALVSANVATTGVLVNQCNGDPERGRLEISRALALPNSVLMRRANEAKKIIEAGEMPSPPQVAAWCGMMQREIERIARRVEFLRTTSRAT